MSVLVEKGSFALTGGTGNQDVTLADSGLTPKVLFLWTTSQTATGFNQDIDIHIGAATGAAQDFSMGASVDDNVASANTGRRRASTRILHTSSDGNGTIDLEIDTVSFGAGTFRVNVQVNTRGTAQIIHYLVIGGTDLTNVRAGEMTLNTATGNQSTTTPGFQPDLVMFITATASSTSTAGAALALGAAKSSSERFYTSWVSDDSNAAGGNVGNVQKSTACIGGLNVGTPGSQEWEADFVSMDANGFTINITDAPGTGWILGWVAFKFSNSAFCDIGVETQPASTSSKSTTGLSVVPKGAIFFGGARASSASIDSGSTAGRLSIGASDGTHEGGVAIHDTDLADNTQVAQRTYTDKAYATMTADSTTTAEADCSFPGGGQFDLNWTVNEGTQREFIYIVFGDTEPAGDVEMSAATAGVATVAARLNEISAMSASMAGAATVASNLNLIESLSAAAAGSTAVVADLAFLETLSASIAGSTSTAALLNLILSLSASSSGSTACAAALAEFTSNNVAVLQQHHHRRYNRRG